MVSRRSFLSKMLLTLATLRFMPTALASSPKPAEPMTAVSLVKSPERVAGLKRAIALSNFPPVNGKRVLIKPNFNTADLAPGSTHIDTIRTLVEEIWARGASEVIIGERSGPPDSQEVMEEKGIFELAKEYDLKIVNFDQLPMEEVERFTRDDLHWKNGFLVPKILNEVDHVIACGCLKTHQYGGVFTMALKLAVGIIPPQFEPFMTEMHRSTHMRKMIAEINLAYSPSLYLIDGVEAFVTGGPSTGKRVQANVTLAANDRIAIDAVGVGILKQLGSTPAIMSVPVFRQEQIARAVELGLGVTNAEQIRIIADDEESRLYAETIERIILEN